jgi:DNA polymerase III subunit epsilon
MFWGILQRLLGRRPRDGVQPLQPWLSRLPASIISIDVETTGLAASDRVVSFAGIGLKTEALASGKFELSYLHLVFDPGKKRHPEAEKVHGYSDWALRFQNPFSVYAEDIRRFVSSYALLVAHNASFDFGFMNREMTMAGLPALTVPVYCTMQGYQALGIGGSASLNAVCQRINLARVGNLHGALEDAWLAMQVYLWLHDCPHRVDLPATVPRIPTNFHEVPPVLEGRTPRRKRIARPSE